MFTHFNLHQKLHLKLHKNLHTCVRRSSTKTPPSKQTKNHNASNRVSVSLLLKANNGWEFSVTHSPFGYNKKFEQFGSGDSYIFESNTELSPSQISPPWHHSILKPEWTFSGFRDPFFNR